MKASIALPQRKYKHIKSNVLLRAYLKKFSIIFLIVTLLFSGFDPIVFIYVYKNLTKGERGGGADRIIRAQKNKDGEGSLFNNGGIAYASINSAEKEYTVDIGPVSGSTTANYVYTSFYNPAGSGRTASIKRIAVRSDTASSTASNYVNLTIRRISTASAGTQITTTNIPKKNASSTNSIIEVRYGGVAVALSGTVDSRILGQPLSGGVGAFYSQRDITFEPSDEKIVIQPGEGIAVYQEAAGAAPTVVRVLIEWDETANAPQAGDGFLFAFPRVEVAATANYVYNSFFNPASSGKSAVIRRIWFGTETCDAVAVYTNDIVLKRTNAASGGTAITASNIPKKNTSSVDSVMEFRHTNVSATTTGGTDARIGNVTPCGAANQGIGWKEINFQNGTEQLVLRQGEGIALISENIGDVDQLVRMIIEWEEVDTSATPAAQGGFFWSSDTIASAAVLNATQYSFFNPAGSGKTAVIKSLAIRVDADGNASYDNLVFRRLSSATGGTLIASSSIPQKNTTSASSSMEIRWCGAACASAITTTYLGTADSRLLATFSPAVVGQSVGQKEMVLDASEGIVLQPGEGIGFYNESASDVNELVKIIVEWDEEASVPTSLGQYLMDIGPISGSIATTYNYISFFNPTGSGKNAVIKRLSVRVDTVNAAVYIPIQLRRITTRSGGTVVASSSYPKKHSSTATSSIEIRTTGMTVSYAGATTSRLMLIQTPGAVPSAITNSTGYQDAFFSDSEPIVLQPGEGIVLYQDPTAGDVDLRVRMHVEWDEEASVPTSQGEYMLAVGPITQSLSANYVYASLFNPLGSAKNYILRKIGIQSDRSGAATVPAYGPITIRRIISASGGTLNATTSISKNTSTGASTAEVRSTGVTVTFTGVTDSRLLGATISGLINQIFGDYASKITPGDELVLKPGEGVALYQEQAAGDTNVRHNFFLEWEEEGTSTPAQSITFTISTSTIYFGTVSPSIARYASSTNRVGSDTEVEAHTFSVITNASNGYTVSAKGQTLTSGVRTIAAIGGTATTSLIGTEQFGIRLVAAGGSGTSTSPYNTSAFAYAATATTSSQVANATVGDNATTTFSVRYLANISPTTMPASYTANVIYVVTANF